MQTLFPALRALGLAAITACGGTADRTNAQAETQAARRPRSLTEFEPEPYPEGNERLSEEIDAVVYRI